MTRLAGGAGVATPWHWRLFCWRCSPRPRPAPCPPLWCWSSGSGSRRFAWPRVFQLLPFLLIGLGMGALTVWWEGHLDNFNHDFDVSLTFLQRALLASRALWVRCRQTFLAGGFHLQLSALGHPPRPHPLAWLPVAGCLALASVLWVRRQKIQRGPLASLAFFVSRPCRHCLASSWNTPSVTAMSRIITNTMLPSASSP